MAGRPTLPWWKPTTKTWLHLLLALPLIAALARGGVTLADYLGYSGLDFIPDFGINPIEGGIRNLGDWAVRILIVALAVTPARRILGRPQIARYRRMIGLWAFAYVTLHMLTFIVVDQQFDWANILKATLKNKFITAGMLGFVLLLPLAITSTNGMIRRLGAARWRKLHKLVYIAGICGAVHYIWMAKSIRLAPGFDAFLDYLWIIVSRFHQPPIYAAIVTILLGLRLWWWAKARTAAPAKVPQPAGRTG
jgi:sulfoxide reductase heme-binding subunit YedZ